jgi:hypothetical protein
MGRPLSLGGPLMQCPRPIFFLPELFPKVHSLPSSSLSSWFMSSWCSTVCARGVQGRGVMRHVARAPCVAGAGLSCCRLHDVIGAHGVVRRSHIGGGVSAHVPKAAGGDGQDRATVARWPDWQGQWLGLNAVGRGGSPEAWHQLAVRVDAGSRKCGRYISSSSPFFSPFCLSYTGGGD